MEFPKSKFAFTVRSTSSRPPKTDEPELTVIAGVKGKFKLNEAGSKLLGLKPYNYLVFVSTEDEINNLKELYLAGDAETVEMVDNEGGIDALTVTWGICAGWQLKDANGFAMTCKKPLTNKESDALVKAGKVDSLGKAIAPDVEAYKGSRLASKMKEQKVGMILEGTDSTNCPALRKGYSEDQHVVYGINPEPITIEVPNGKDGDVATVNVFAIAFAREEEKIERNSD